MALYDIGPVPVVERVDKKEACLKLGAEKWVDFKASKDLVADVIAAAGKPGPHTALITTPSVSRVLKHGPLRRTSLFAFVVRGIRCCSAVSSAIRDHSCDWDATEERRGFNVPDAHLCHRCEGRLSR